MKIFHHALDFHFFGNLETTVIICCNQCSAINTTCDKPNAIYNKSLGFLLFNIIFESAAPKLYFLIWNFPPNSQNATLTFRHTIHRGVKRFKECSEPSTNCMKIKTDQNIKPFQAKRTTSNTHFLTLDCTLTLVELNSVFGRNFIFLLIIANPTHKTGQCIEHEIYFVRWSTSLALLKYEVQRFVGKSKVRSKAVM